jgi:beta-lactamase superfamily II metal-dependent hydrolase
MIDICDGNLPVTPLTEDRMLAKAALDQRVRGNFQMCENPTNPLTYLDNLEITNIWRFVLTHPDMDHMDGVDNLCEQFSVANFWDSGARRPKPDFSNGPFLESDWDRYVKVRDGGEGTNALQVKEGRRFRFANKTDTPGESGDGLHILAPNDDLMDEADDDLNDSSYVTLYRSAGGRILLPGDARAIAESW